VVAVCPSLTATAQAAHDLEQTQRQYQQGRYRECIAAAQAAIADREFQEDWRTVLVQAYLATGQYTNALQAVTDALERYGNSIRMQFLARTVYLYNNRPDQAQSALRRIGSLASNRMWAYRDPASLVALGQAALLLGADARRVLEQFFDQAKRQDPNLRDVYLASGQLALEKNDFQLAARVFNEGLKVLPNDPDLHCGLARAFAPSDRLQMLKSLDAALSINSNHVPSYLLLADHLVDGEEYTLALERLDRALAVHPCHSEAWAYRAVVAHLQGDRVEEMQSREKALVFWTNNPAVDHLIGRKLSQKYLFQEGAACQRRALATEPSYLPAKIQLAQDLLRLGHETEGWKLSQEVHAEDGYDVTAFNLVNLKEVLDRFTTLTNQNFVLRMNPREAALYGPRALDILSRARERLCAKYSRDLKEPIVVEIFHEQKDFGVRTFGLPDNPGYLGVCFGPVITANSPAAHTASPNNWEAVLWHEFTHVVTLHLTGNRMPRWLSEGLSVYEERQANPAWGQIMNPRYRETILKGELTPVGQLSAAFLAPKSPFHLQFAYYQSYLVVEFLARQFGLERIRAILNDLGQGVEINAAIARHTAPLDRIETDFENFAREQAEALGAGLVWARPDPDELAQATPEWLAQQGSNYYVLMHRAKVFLDEQQWEQAKEILQRLVDSYPDQRGPESAYLLLAEAHRGLNESREERAVLTKLALVDADAVNAYSRLMELDRDREDWEGVQHNAQRYLAVNPLVAEPYRCLADAAEALGQTTNAIAACQNLLLLDPADPAGLHCRLARLLYQTGNPAARRHVLQALEEAPRFREAHQLLLDILEEQKPASKPVQPSKPETTAPADKT
jgi:tetratricopeptide (TPR) repeat protein